WHTAAGSRSASAPAAVPALACSSPPAGARDPSTTPTQPRTEAMTQQTILVVDDEAPMRKLLSSNLKASGYAVRAAADGTEALKLIQQQPFDLLLLDLSLPGPNGLQVLEAVRRDAELPVLIVSGRGRERDTVEALDLGADDYLSKPFGVAELLARVKA